MPYDIVRDGIEKSLREKCRLLKEYIRQAEKRAGKLLVLISFVTVLIFVCL